MVSPQNVLVFLLNFLELSMISALSLSTFDGIPTWLHVSQWKDLGSSIHASFCPWNPWNGSLHQADTNLHLQALHFAEPSEPSSSRASSCTRFALVPIQPDVLEHSRSHQHDWILWIPWGATWNQLDCHLLCISARCPNLFGFPSGNVSLFKNSIIFMEEILQLVDVEELW